MEETSWVRSVYLYLMCVVSIALIAIGAVGAAVGIVHTIAPDLGHRDTIDRVGIGLSNVATEVVGLVEDQQNAGVEEFCRDVTDSDDEFDECMEDETGGSAEGMKAIRDGIAEVRSELRSQIRNNSIDRIIRGVLAIVVGWLLFRIHGRRTELFAGGVRRKRVKASPAVTEGGDTPDAAPPAVAMD